MMHWDTWMRKKADWYAECKSMRLYCPVQSVLMIKSMGANAAHLEHTCIFYAFWLYMSFLPLGNCINQSWKSNQKEIIIYGQLLWWRFSIFAIYLIQVYISVNPYHTSFRGNPQLAPVVYATTIQPTLFTVFAGPVQSFQWFFSVAYGHLMNPEPYQQSYTRLHSLESPLLFSWCLHHSYVLDIFTKNEYILGPWRNSWSHILLIYITYKKALIAASKCRLLVL